MPTAEARVETERPSRYLVQLCKHFSTKGRHLGRRLHGHPGGDEQALRAMRAVAERAQVKWSDAEGHVDLPWGQIDVRAVPGVLVLRVEAAEEDDLRRLRGLVAGHVERFGRRDRLRVNWEETDSATGSPAARRVGDGLRSAPGSGARGSRLKVVGIVAIVLAVHLGLGGVLLSNWRWTGWAAGGLLALVLVKAALLGGFAVRRGRASKGR
jgi:hypothetical protein